MPSKRHVLRQRALGEFDIALARAVDTGGPADQLRRRQQLRGLALHQLLDLLLLVVGELVAVRPEQLDAVVDERVVRGRDHHAEIGAERAGQHGDGRRRHRTELEHIHAHGGEAGDERGLDHVAREPRILADHHAMAIRAIGEQLAGGHPHFEGHLGGHGMGVRAATDAIRAKIFARHCEASPSVPCRCRSLVMFCPARHEDYALRFTILPFKNCKQKLHPRGYP